MDIRPARRHCQCGDAPAEGGLAVIDIRLQWGAKSNAVLAGGEHFDTHGLCQRNVFVEVALQVAGVDRHSIMVRPQWRQDCEGRPGTPVAVPRLTGRNSLPWSVCRQLWMDR